MAKHPGTAKISSEPTTSEENRRVSPKLTPKQVAGVAALMTSPSVRAAAQSCGMSETTIYAWLRLPAFQEALQAAAGDAMRHAMARLQARTEKAIDTLERVCDDEEEGGSAKVAAARALLDFGFKSLQVGEIESMLAEMRALAAEMGREEP